MQQLKPNIKHYLRGRVRPLYRSTQRLKVNVSTNKINPKLPIKERDDVWPGPKLFSINTIQTIHYKHDSEDNNL